METNGAVRYFSEAIGTFALVLIGCSAAAISGGGHPGLTGIGQLGIALAFGLTVLIMVYAIGGISGCHINPAITLAMLVAGKIKPAAAAGYVLAQFVGAVLGAGMLVLIQKGNRALPPGNGLSDRRAGGRAMQAVMIPAQPS